MAKKAVTIYIDDSGLKLLEAKGKEVKKWAALSITTGAVSEGVITDPEYVANELKELLDTHGVKRKKIIVGLSGLHCLYRVITLPVLPRSVLAEAVRSEAERILPVPIDEFYISWQIIHQSKDELRIFLVAYPREASDALVETLRQAHMEPHVVDLAPLALCRVEPRGAAVIVDIRATEVDIVIKIEGVPELIRSLPLPGEAESLEKKLSTVRDELKRTIKFYNSNHPDQPLESEVPICVSGEEITEGEFDPSYLEKLGHPVLLLTPPLKYPKDFNIYQYMVNVGLALRELRLAKKSGLSVTEINIIPESYLPKPPSLTKILLVPSIIAAAALLIFIATQVQDSAADTASLRSQVDATNQLIGIENKGLQSQEKAIADLKERIAQRENIRDRYTRVLNELAWWQELINGNLELSAEKVPSTMELALLEQRELVLNIRGRSPTEVGILSYTRSLDNSGRFQEYVIDSITREESECSENMTDHMDFNLIFDSDEGS